MSETLRQIGELEGDERTLAGDSTTLAEETEQAAAKDRAAELDKFLAEAREKTERLRRRLQKAAPDELSEDGNDELKRAQESAKQLRRLLGEREWGEARKEAERAVSSLRRLRRELDQREQKNPRPSAAHEEFAEAMAEARGIAQEIASDLERLTPKPGEGMSPEQKGRSQGMSERQGSLGERAEELAREAAGNAGKAGGLEQAADELREIGEQMGQAQQDWPAASPGTAAARRATPPTAWPSCATSCATAARSQRPQPPRAGAHPRGRREQGPARVAPGAAGGHARESSRAISAKRCASTTRSWSDELPPPGARRPRPRPRPRRRGPRCPEPARFPYPSRGELGQPGAVPGQRPVQPDRGGDPGRTAARRVALRRRRGRAGRRWRQPGRHRRGRCTCEGTRASWAATTRPAVAKLHAALEQAPDDVNIKSLGVLVAAADKAIEGHSEQRSKHFVLRFPPEDAVLADYALEALEAALANLSADLGLHPRAAHPRRHLPQPHRSGRGLHVDRAGGAAHRHHRPVQVGAPDGDQPARAVLRLPLARQPVARAGALRGLGPVPGSGAGLAAGRPGQVPGAPLARARPAPHLAAGDAAPAGQGAGDRQADQGSIACTRRWPSCPPPRTPRWRSPRWPPPSRRCTPGAGCRRCGRPSPGCARARRADRRGAGRGRQLGRVRTQLEGVHGQPEVSDLPRNGAGHAKVPQIGGHRLPARADRGRRDPVAQRSGQVFAARQHVAAT